MFTFNDRISTEQRVGERHPIYLALARAIVYAGIISSVVVGFATVLTVHATAKLEYANQRSFIPVHLPIILRK